VRDRGRLQWRRGGPWTLTMEAWRTVDAPNGGVEDRGRSQWRRGGPWTLTMQAWRTVEAHNGAVDDHNGGVEAQFGAPEGLLTEKQS
jgi:hypothetical protein